MREKLLKPRAFALYALALIAGGIVAWPALASVTVTPMIVVMEGRDRYADVNLVNTSDKTKSYAVKWIYRNMVEGSGEYEVIEQSTTPFDLAKNLVMTPRRVTIEPGGMQKIRLGLRLKGEPPPPGDYRAHLQMEDDNGPPELPEPDKPLKEGEILVGVKINVGISIPVIYRVGESDATASIGEMKTQINPKTKQIELVIPVTRSGGPFGLYGHMKIMYGGKLVGEIKNANIFPEIKQRIFVIPLNVESLNAGALDVVYENYNPKDNTVYAQKSFNVR